MPKLFQKLGILIGKRPTWVLVATLLIIPIAFFGMTLIDMDTGLDTFVAKDSRVYQEYDSYNNAFAPTSSIIVMLTADDTLDYDVLTAMSRLGDTLDAEEDIIQVTSLASLIKDITAEYYGAARIPDSRASINEITSQLPPDIIRALAPDEQHAIISVAVPSELTNAEMEHVLYKVESAMEWADFPPDVGYTVTGDPVFTVEMQREMNSSLMVTLTLSAVLMVVILSQVFRHVRWKLLPFAAVIVGLVWTFGAMGIASVPMTMITTAVFPLLIGVGIDYAIQIHNRMDEEVKGGKSLRFAAMESVRRVGPAVGIAVILAVLGYLSLFTSPIPMVRDFGVMGIMGLVLCYLSAIFFLPPLLEKLYRRRGKAARKTGPASTGETGGQGAMAHWLSRVSLKAARYPLMVLVVAGVLCGVGYYYDQGVELTLEEEDMVPPDMPAMVKMTTWRHLVGETTTPVNLMIRADDVTDPDVLEWMDEFGEYEVETREEVKSASSLATLIKDVNGGELPATGTEAALILERLPDAYKEGYFENQTLAAMNLGVSIDSPLEMGAIRDKISQDLDWKEPPIGVDITVTGQNVVLASVIKGLTTGRYTMNFLSLALIFAGLMIIYRDWRKALLPVVPVAFVTGFTGGIMYTLGLDYNPATSVIGALSFGLGAEYSVLVMSRYFEEKSRGRSPMKAIEIATQKIGVAVAASCITSIAGFSALLLSEFPMLQSFGTITVIIFALVLLVTFTVLPALIVALDSWKLTRKKSAEITSLSI